MSIFYRMLAKLGIMKGAARSPEGAHGDIQSVLDQLDGITHEQVEAALTAKLGIDPDVGIIIQELQIPQVRTATGYEYIFYAARVLSHSPQKPNYVRPHYHMNGNEPYRFLSGASGEMNTGTVADGQVVWNPSRTVVPGDVIIVQEGEVHSFRNNGTEPFDFIFSCPFNHLVDNSPEHPDGDRYFTDNLRTGIPPWY